MTTARGLLRDAFIVVCVLGACWLLYETVIFLAERAIARLPR